MSYEDFRRAIYEVIEDRTGMNPHVFVDLPIDEQRKHMERRTGKPMQFTGVDSGMKVLSHSEVEAMLDKALL
ncbi:hypothetical protein CMI45_01050 [Candidatus Pacearchaeota archaeon]|jgi:hypothetical protein|nr:hypothetical protein [Candidatus Pacearchaeota archaeon]|tara:strand:+ start:1858 stop:2073 length:216 start_codon:yes stop_codon:yes gene_type:complete